MIFALSSTKVNKEAQGRKNLLTVDESDQVVLFAVWDERLFLEDVVDELVHVGAI